MRPALLILLAALAGCSGSEPAVEPPRPLQPLAPELRIQTLWQADAGAVINRRRIPLDPLWVDGQVVVADFNGLLTGYDPADGRRLWRHDLAMRLTTAPAAGRERRLYLVGTEGRVLAVSLDDAQPVWTAQATSEVLTPPVEVGDLVVVRGVDGRVQAWSREDAGPRWSFYRDVPALSLRGNSRPLVVDGRLVVGLDDGRVVALDPGAGVPLWERSLAQPGGRSEVERLVDIDADPVAAAGAIYVGAYQGRVARFELDGRIVWAREASVVTRPALAADGLFFVDADSEIIAFDPVRGSQLWRQDALRGRRLSPPATLGDYLVVGDLEGYVHWLAQEDGRILARVQVDPYPVVAAPLVRDDRVFVHTQGGTLAALRVRPAD